MRFNKQELATLATQPPNRFEKEGILHIRERQESFFRRTEEKSCLKSSTRNECVPKRRKSSLRGLNCYGSFQKVYVERWCRLRGNLLFYLKTGDKWSEPLGVIVLEQCQLRIEPPPSISNIVTDNQYQFYIVFSSGLCQCLAANSESERSEWMSVLSQANFSNIKAQLQALQQCIERKIRKNNLNLQDWRERRGLHLDVTEMPICELSLACDNLLCDGNGEPPNPAISVHVYLPAYKLWLDYATTETAEKCSNAQFLTTISFRSSDGITNDSIVRFVVHDVREKFSQVTLPLGSACVPFNILQDATRLRVSLTPRSQFALTETSSNMSSVGFLTLNSWTLEAEDRGSSTENTPCRTINPNLNDPQTKIKNYSHRRSQSLPPKLGVKLKLPVQAELRLLFSSIYLQTYRFHSGLGGDICVYEMMAESRICFTFPQQLLSVWINQEKELLQEVAGMGELREPWHSKQLDLLDRHLQLLRLYSQARENLQAYKGSNFKQSSRKNDRSLEFAPTNLHLQRMWVHNDTLNKSGFYDLITVGAFTAHAHKSKNGGLIKLVQQLKESPSLQQENGNGIKNHGASKIIMAYDAIQAIKQLRREVVEAMKQLMLLAKQKQTIGMLNICEELMTKTKILLSLWDADLVEEALSFVEENKLIPADSIETFNLKDPQRPTTFALSPFKRITQQLTNLQLKSPELDDFATPCTPSVKSVDEIWRKTIQEKNEEQKQASKCLNQQLNENETIESLSTDLKFLKMRKHNSKNEFAKIDEEDNLVNNNSEDNQEQFVIYPEVDNETTNIWENKKNNNENESSLNNEKKTKTTSEIDAGRAFLDTKVMSACPSANYYKPTDEPEPWDLTQLNIEASVMCLVSKVKFLCGRCGSPAVRLRNQKLITHTFRTSKNQNTSKLIETSKNNVVVSDSSNCDIEIKNGVSNKQIENLSSNNKESIKKINKFTQGLDLATISDWASELRPSMRKLRQAMDGLLKTARLAHSVLRLQQDTRMAQRACNVRYRRDVCFSQALTSLVTGLLTKFWCQKPDVTFITCICKGLGPLVLFEGLLSYYGDEIDMFGDMSVAIEDLRTVGFQLMHSPVPGNFNTSNSSVPNNQDVPERSNSIPGKTEFIQYPQPKVIGGRNSLTVLLPVPDSVYSLLPTPKRQKNNLTFHITPVFFNVGINEMATLAETLGLTKQQDRSNIDNFERLNEYYIRYKKLNLPNNLDYENYKNIGRVSLFNNYSNQKSLDELMVSLRASVTCNKPKNVESLHIASQICRLMKGIKFTSCKSAKDRTGMSVTLEQCQILMSEYHLADFEFQKALDCMRSEGCRRENCQKNIGIRKYAFNTLQLYALPKLYRPPYGSNGSAQS